MQLFETRQFATHGSKLVFCSSSSFTPFKATIEILNDSIWSLVGCGLVHLVLAQQGARAQFGSNRRMRCSLGTASSTSARPPKLHCTLDREREREIVEERESVCLCVFVREREERAHGSWNQRQRMNDLSSTRTSAHHVIGKTLRRRKRTCDKWLGTSLEATHTLTHTHRHKLARTCAVSSALPGLQGALSGSH